MRAPLAARREPAGDQNRQLNVQYGFEHKTWYILKQEISYTPKQRHYCTPYNMIPYHLISIILQ